MAIGLVLSVRSTDEHGFVSDKPDNRSRARLPSELRRRVLELRERGASYTEIAAALEVSKSTVAYHVRNAGIPADDRFSVRYDWCEVQRAIDEGASFRDCMRRFGFCRDSWGKAVARGDITPRDWITPIEELLSKGKRRSRGHIKRRLIGAGLKEERCEHCGISEWQGRALSLQLHHKNGDGNDNRIENLELLCPNCHSQTDTYGGRNGHRRKPAE